MIKLTWLNLSKMKNLAKKKMSFIHETLFWGTVGAALGNQKKELGNLGKLSFTF